MTYLLKFNYKNTDLKIGKVTKPPQWENVLPHYTESAAVTLVTKVNGEQ